MKSYITNLSTTPGLSNAELKAFQKSLEESKCVIEAGFVSFRIAVVDENASQATLDEMRCIFFAGAQHAFSSAMGIISPEDNKNKTECDFMSDIERLRAISLEMTKFIAIFELTHAAARGNA